MPPPSSLPLHEWETFYVIIGSSAAALTGLMFVVIALSAERGKLGVEDSAAALDSFATPTLFIGIHNAWDAAVWIATSVEPPAPPPPSPSGGASV